MLTASGLSALGADGRAALLTLFLDSVASRAHARDPYALWQLLTSSIDASDKTDVPQIPLLIELADPVALLAGTVGSSTGTSWSAPLWQVFLPARRPGLPKFRVHSVMTNVTGLLGMLLGDAVAAPADGGKAVAIVRAELGLARRRSEKERAFQFNFDKWLRDGQKKADAAVAKGATVTTSTASQSPVLVCVVDDRFNYAASDFARRDIAVWHQGGSDRTVEGLESSGAWACPLEIRMAASSPVVKFDFAGPWLGRKRVAFAATRGVAQRSEADVYRLERYIDPAPRWSHGSAVLDLVAGAQRWQGTSASRPGWATSSAHDADLTFVQLPVPSVLDTSGGSLAGNALDAIHWALHRAADGQAVVVNLSYGAHTGGHDATSIWDRGLKELLDHYDGRSPAAQGKTLHVVLPAGNSQLLRCHASAHLGKPGDEARWRWQVRADNDEDAYLELWLPEDGGLKWQLTVTAPDGQQRCVSGPSVQYWPALNESQSAGAALLWCERVAQSRRGTMVLLAAGPTRRTADPKGSLRSLLSEQAGSAPQSLHGIYDVHLRLMQGQPTSHVHVWAQRADNAPGRGRQLRGHSGRQSLLLDCSDEPPGAPIDPRFTLNGISSLKHERLHVVGAMRAMDSSLSAYSAAGPNRLDPQRVEGPDVVVAADESLNQPGLLVKGLIGGARLRLPGTSVAAAAYARALVEHLLAGGGPSVPGICPAAPTRELEPEPRGSPTRASPWLRGEARRAVLPRPPKR